MASPGQLMDAIKDRILFQREKIIQSAPFREYRQLKLIQKLAAVKFYLDGNVDPIESTYLENNGWREITSGQEKGRWKMPSGKFYRQWIKDHYWLSGIKNWFKNHALDIEHAKSCYAAGHHDFVLKYTDRPAKNKPLGYSMIKCRVCNQEDHYTYTDKKKMTQEERDRIGLAFAPKP